MDGGWLTHRFHHSEPVLDDLDAGIGIQAHADTVNGVGVHDGGKYFLVEQLVQATAIQEQLPHGFVLGNGPVGEPGIGGWSVDAELSGEAVNGKGGTLEEFLEMHEQNIEFYLTELQWKLKFFLYKKKTGAQE